MTRHLENVHDVGTLVCDYCVGNCFKRILHYDTNVGKQYICRKCYKKATGYKCRAEEQMVSTIENNALLGPYIVSSKYRSIIILFLCVQDIQILDQLLQEHDGSSRWA